MNLKRSNLWLNLRRVLWYIGKMNVRYSGGMLDTGGHVRYSGGMLDTGGHVRYGGAC